MNISSGRLYSVVTSLILAMLIIGSVVLIISTRAYGEQGGTGPGTGCGSAVDACTTAGTDWLKFSSASNSLPNGFQAFIKNADGSRTQWADVATMCRNSGNNTVWVYVAYYTDHSYRFKGLNYITSGGQQNNQYYQNSQITQAGIKINYDAANFHDPKWVWGKNVAWFCWSDQNYKLTPSITVNPVAADPQSLVSLSPSVDNQGTTVAPSTSEWYISVFAMPSVGVLPVAGVSASDPLSYYKHSASKVVSATRGFNKGGTLLSVVPQEIPNFGIGTRVCYTLSVRQYTQTDNRWNHSAPSCVVVSKYPKAQVRSGDLDVGRGTVYNTGRLSGITTSVSVLSGTAYGSWGEYSIAASGLITGMASASGYVGGSATTNLCSLSILSFTINGTGGGCSSVGFYSQAYIAPDIASRFPINVAAKDASPTNPADPKILPKTTINITTDNLLGRYQAPNGVSSLTITGGNQVAKGQWVVINAPGVTVNITGNITYTSDPISALAEIPQVIIIAKNIIIDSSVTQIDAWLVAAGSGVDGRINTCGSGGVDETSALTYNQCNQRLLVNGPVYANHLIMRRTAGADGGHAGDPAEIFNLRPDAYLWATNYNFSVGSIPTAQIKELPPRF